jgi:hypothetical protein
MARFGFSNTLRLIGRVILHAHGTARVIHVTDEEFLIVPSERASARVESG